MTKPLTGQFDVTLAFLSSSLLESVEYVNPFCELGDIEHSVLHTCVNADFINSYTDAGHRFPVVRLQTLLDEVKLMSSNSSGILREGPDVVEGRSEPVEGLLSHNVIYKILYIPANFLSAETENRRDW